MSFVNHSHVWKKIGLLILAATCTLVLSESVSAKPDSTDIPQKTIDTIGLFIQHEIKARKIPGLQLAIIKAGKIQMLRSYGIADIAHQVPVSNLSVFSINSATKSFTAVAIMQLHSQGKLDLSAPVSNYLSDLPLAWQGITLTQLLDHTSGLPNIIDQNTSALAFEGGVEQAWKQVLSMPIEFAAGERFSYNQTNYLLLGKILRKQSGMPFTQFIQQGQFDAADMRQTGFGDARDVIPNKATSYTITESLTYKPVIDDFPALLRAGAGINASAEDIARWLIALQQGKLLSQPALARMWTRGKFNNGSLAPWALGWPAFRLHNFPSFAGIGGARSTFYVYPKNDLAIVILTNLAGANPQQLVDTIAAYILPDFKNTEN